METKIRIALAGNPNAGKTTLYNALTGSNQFVGNWPGVTVEKKEGSWKKDPTVLITDLPGIYSLSPYTPEEVVARQYLVLERPDAILNIVDGTNIERNLYLTTQLIELGIPVVVAVNMIDVVRHRGDKLDTASLARQLGCPVVELSALRNIGVQESVQEAVALVERHRAGKYHVVARHTFSGAVEHALAHIEESTVHHLPPEQQRWYAIKVFERDEKVLAQLEIASTVRAHLEEDIRCAEAELDDDAESIITNERYLYIARVLSPCYQKKNPNGLTASDRIDRIVTNRFLALPIFALVMFCIYFISVTTVGTWATDFTNDGLFGEGWHLFGIERIWVPGIPVLLESALDAIHCADWLKALLVDGIVGGVGAVLGFVPQILVLFLFLSFLEACGYMARIAFVMDKIFRKFGLSGKSFIPMLIGTGCSVPGIMASRTIENERDRRMTVLTTSFIPCGAKLPVIALISSALFGGAWWVAPSAYFVGMAAVILSGLMLKKTKPFLGDPAPFVMELPSYHLPTAKTVFLGMWERGWSFIKKAGTIILLSCVLIWLFSSIGFTEHGFGFDHEMELENSLLGKLGAGLCFLFAPLGFGNAKAAIATLMGLLAKEEIVGVFGVLDLEQMTKLSAYSFLLFNLLCAPCVAAMGAIRREMNSAKWTAFAIGYQCLFAYAVSLILYQFGTLFLGVGSVVGFLFALLALGAILFFLLRPDGEKLFSRKGKERAK